MKTSWTAVIIAAASLAACAPSPVVPDSPQWWTPQTIRQVESNYGHPTPPKQWTEAEKALIQGDVDRENARLAAAQNTNQRAMVEAQCRMIVNSAYPVTPSRGRTFGQMFANGIVDSFNAVYGGAQIFNDCMTANGY